MTVQEALTGAFTDDPINWIKWAIVFAILIGGYIIFLPIYKKVDYRLSWGRKADIAKSRNHVIKATLVDYYRHLDDDDWYSATYVYTIDGKQRRYDALFQKSRPPQYLTLYYLDNPKKLFSCKEYHYENHKGIILIPIIAMPWILAALALILLGVDTTGFS